MLQCRALKFLTCVGMVFHLFLHFQYITKHIVKQLTRGRKRFLSFVFYFMLSLKVNFQALFRHTCEITLMTFDFSFLSAFILDSILSVKETLTISNSYNKYFGNICTNYSHLLFLFNETVCCQFTPIKVSVIYPTCNTF